MKTHRTNTVLIFYFIAAILSIQWSTAHIHLSEQHDHDGGPHYHSIEAHAHHPGNLHAVLIELSHQANADVVEIDHKYRLTNSTNQKKLPDTIQASAFQTPLLCLSKIQLSEIITTKLGYLYQSTVYLRGPPLLS